MFGEIPDFLIAWIEKQQMFFVASAPLAADGLVNISPKGVEGTFHVANSRKVWYEDLSGSGVETIAHIRENGRVTIMLNAYEGPPRITRLYGRGSVHEFGTPEYNALLPEGVRHAGSRAAIVLDIIKVSTTCGYSVPFYEFKSHRGQLLQWAAKKEATDRECELAEGFSSSTSPRVQSGMKRWWEERNTKSLDGLRGLVSAHVTDQVFQPTTSTPSHADTWSATAPSNSYYKKLPGALGAIDFRLIVAFLFGVLLPSLYGRFVLAAQQLLNISS